MSNVEGLQQEQLKALTWKRLLQAQRSQRGQCESGEQCILSLWETLLQGREPTSLKKLNWKCSGCYDISNFAF